ncbi:MAG: 6-bladed beta-propeller [Candidatus Cyclobacteriaceae bacterium M3_2C_046]
MKQLYTIQLIVLFALISIQPMLAQFQYLKEVGAESNGELQLNFPEAIAKDPNGNLLILNRGDNRVLKIDADGTILDRWLVEGNLRDIEVDHLGNIYIIISTCYCVKKFDSDFNFIKQWGSFGSGDTQFYNIEGIALDENYVYISGYYHGKIVKFDLDGNFIKTWGTKGSNDGELINPRGLEVDQDGNIYVADYGNHRIQKFDHEGQHLLSFGTHGDENGQFKGPWDLKINSSGRLYVSDFNNNRIQEFDLQGNFQSKFGGYDFFPGDGDFWAPKGICFDNHDNLFVVDNEIHNLQKFDANGDVLIRLGPAGKAGGEFDKPAAIAIDKNDHVYIADRGNYRIQKFDTEENLLGIINGGYGINDGEFSEINALALDHEGNLYVADWSEYHHLGRVQVFDSDGNFVKKVTTANEFDQPSGIAFDHNGKMYVSELINRVQVFDPEQTYLTSWEGEALFDQPQSIAVSSDNLIFIVDRSDRVLKFDPDGNLISSWGTTGEGNGEFKYPCALTIDQNNNVLVLDREKSQVQVFNKAGTYLGQFGNYGIGFGEFYKPYDLAIANSGKIYISNEFNHNVTVYNSIKSGQTINFAALTDKQYGDPAFELEATASSGLPVTFTSSNPSVLTVDGTTATVIGAGNAIITAQQAGNIIYLAAPDLERSITVHKTDQTITFELDPEKPYGSILSLSGSSSSSLPITYTSSNNQVAIITEDQIKIAGTGTATITASQSGNDNYHAAEPVTREITGIKAKTEIILGPISDKTHGQESFKLSATANIDATINFSSNNDSIIAVDGDKAQIIGAGSAVITASIAETDLHTAAQTSVTIMVNKATQQVVFDSIPEVVYGSDPVPLLAYTESDNPVVFESTDPQIATISDNFAEIKHAGTVEIVAIQSGNENYLPASSSRLLVINKADQQLSLPDLALTFGDEPFSLQPEASSGAPVKVTSSSSEILYIENGMATILKAGEVKLFYEQSGNQNYHAIVDSQLVVIEKANQTISFPEIAEKSLSDQPFQLEASASSGLPVTYTCSDPAIAALSGNILEILSAGSVVITARQTGNENYHEAEEIQQTLVINTVTSLKEYSSIEWQIYPNPASEWVKIHLPDQRLSNQKLSLINLEGNIIFTEKIVLQKEFCFDLSHLPSGQYFIIINSGSKAYQKKLIKQ